MYCSLTVGGFSFSGETVMDLAIIIHTVDSYNFLWSGWNYYFQKYWDFNIDASIYFMNEEATVDFSNVKQIKTEKGPWSDRLINGLSQISEKNVFYMQEDFWLIKTLDKDFFESAFRFFIANNMDAFRITIMGNYKLWPTMKFFKKHNVKRFNNRKSMYLVCHQASFWKKDFFLNCLLPNETPWENEISGTERIRKIRPKLYMIREHWYNEVCRKGEFTDIGEKMVKEVQ